METIPQQIVRFSLEDENIGLGTRKAALGLRKETYQCSDESNREIIIGHCVIKGAINEDTRNAIVNFYVGVEPEPTDVDSSVFMLGVYRVPELFKNDTDIIDFVGRGLSKTVKQSLSIIRDCSEAIGSQTISSDETDKARRYWRQLLVGDYLALRGMCGQSRNLLQEDYAEDVSNTALLYVARSKNRYCNTTQAIVAKAMEVM